MESVAFVSPGLPRSQLLGSTAARVCNRVTKPAQPAKWQIQCAEENKKPKVEKAAPKSKKGFFGRLTDTLLRPIVSVPGGGTGGDLLECVFCKGTGFNDCDACLGSGKDKLGTCMMCDGKTSLTCTVCSGVGTVDRIRRGGTDDSNEYTVKKSRQS